MTKQAQVNIGMVGHVDHDCVVGHPGFVERLQQAADDAVEILDGAVVARPRAADLLVGQFVDAPALAPESHGLGEGVEVALRHLGHRQVLVIVIVEFPGRDERAVWQHEAGHQ